MRGRSERQPIYRALYGLGCVSSAALVRSGKLVGGKVGILPVFDFRNTMRLRDLGAGSSTESLIADVFRLSKDGNDKT
jgi:hypothetical protein